MGANNMDHNVEKHKITVEGMSCGHCKKAVEEAVRALPGIQSADVDLEAKLLIVEFDVTKTTLLKIKEAVEEEGYTVI